MTTKSSRRTRLALTACLFLALLARSAPAPAVPVPFKNCGQAGDLLAVQQVAASVWPPPTPAPLVATVTLDPVTGQVTQLSVVLQLGPNWMFESGPLPTTLNPSGFVSLPSSFPLNLTNALPVALGPYNTLDTYGHGSGSFQVVTKAALKMSVEPGVQTSLSLTFNGTPGFPLAPAPGIYQAQVQMTQASGQRVFCAAFSLPNLSFVNVAPQPAPAPALSGPGLVALMLLVAALGSFAWWRRSS